MFRGSATLILNVPHRTRYPGDFGTVLLKRTSQLKFMPNSYVFPGGAVSSSDSDEKWMNHFTKKEVRALTPSKSSVPRPPLFETPKDELIPRDLSLRITAIRETFEESGILLLEDEKTGDLVKNVPPKSELKKWRTLVEGDSTQFYELCRELGAYPKVDELSEWSNWLTPPGILPRRFDTAFYVAKINSLPDYAAEDGGETVHFAVMNPFEALDKSLNQEIILHPPQFTEISRMAKFYDLEILMDYAKKRQERGILRWCPVQYYFNGCRISAMVGDDLSKDVTEDIPVRKEFENDELEQNISICQNVMRTVWSYKTNEKGKKIYGRMWTRTNLLYFDPDTLMNTPIDQTALEYILSHTPLPVS